MKQILTITLALCLMPYAFSQSYPSWISNGHFPDASPSTATVVRVDQSGNILLGGKAENNFVMKLNGAGEIMWLQEYDSGDTISESPNTLCVDNLGNAYITFMKHTLGGTYWSIAVQKYNGSDGTILWTTEFADAQFNGFEWQVKPKFMTIDNNHLYVAGTKFEPGGTEREMLVFKMNFDGNIIWYETHKGSGIYANSKSVAVDASGNVYIAGDAWNASIDYCVVKFDPDGTLIWDAFLDGDVFHDTDIAESVLVDNSGNVYITGYNQISSTLTDIVTAKYNQNGVFQWKQSYGNPEYRDNNAYYLEITNEGDILVGGYSAYQDPYPGTGKDYILLKYSPSGSLIWDARYDHKNYLNDHPFDFDMDPEGNVYICGITMKSCYIYTFITAVKVNPQGDIEWDIREPNLYGTPWEIAVIDEGRFVIAAGAFDTIQQNDATAIYYTPGTPPVYEADILDVYFNSQIAPAIIDYGNRRVIATVHDTANIEHLIPFITRSEHSCMYPDDEVVTSFIEPIWYNITSFDEEIEQWWIVEVQGGHVGLDEYDGADFLIYPNPCRDKIQITNTKNQNNSTPNTQHSTLQIIDLCGKVVHEEEMASWENGAISVDVSHLPAGLYLVKLQTEDAVGVRKLIVQ